MTVIGITGSTDGIGCATARVLLADEHRVSPSGSVDAAEIAWCRGRLKTGR
jgi:NAD(P)-dependent dehydrogenase (short-subunit alcohol dehydrogenase family)